MYKLFFKIILLHSIVFSHQFFLTTTEVRLSDSQKSLEITIQTFSHDVEALLKKANFNLMKILQMEISMDLLSLIWVNEQKINAKIYLRESLLM